MRLGSYKENTKVSLEIRDSKNRISNIGSRGQTKNLKRRRCLSGLYSNSNGLKMAYI